MGSYIELKDLEVYKLSRELSTLAWKIYQTLSWQEKKTIGDQFLESADSIGANIAEGYHRYHFKDKIKFYYNSRGSLAESSAHWLSLLYERKKIDMQTYQHFIEVANKLNLKLNNFIASTHKSINQKSSQ